MDIVNTSAFIVNRIVRGLQVRLAIFFFFKYLACGFSALNHCNNGITVFRCLLTSNYKEITIKNASFDHAWPGSVKDYMISLSKYRIWKRNSSFNIFNRGRGLSARYSADDQSIMTAF